MPAPQESPPQEHRSNAPAAVRCAAVTVSDTRTQADDKGGALLARLLEDAGHELVVRCIIPDEPQEIADLIDEVCRRDDVDALLMTGGTGIAPRDHTIDAVQTMLSKELPGYGEIFRMLSYQEIGPAAMLSRAIGGVVDSTVVLTMPGSPAAVRLAVEQLILPELGHLVGEATKGQPRS